MDRVARSIDAVVRRSRPPVAPVVKKAAAWAAVIAVGVGVAWAAAQLYPRFGGERGEPAARNESQVLSANAPAASPPPATTAAPMAPKTTVASTSPAEPTVLAPTKRGAVRRVALVIGNSNYQSVAKLRHPAGDASAIAKMLAASGFEVILQNDARNIEFKRAVRRFGDALVNAETGLIFYAGYGIAVRGVNYLIPVDAKLASDRDAEDEAVSLDRLVLEMDEAGDQSKLLRLIMLDACQDNPFVRTVKVPGGPTRSVAGGLSAIQPTSSNMLIAYAAKAGLTCEEGTGEHSPFTQALLRNLAVPGLDIRLAFGRIRDEVLRTTHSQQEPYVYGSLGGGVVSLVPGSPQTQQPSERSAKDDYERIAKIGTKKAYEVFLGTYKTGFYADLARAQLEELRKREQDR